MAHIDENWLEYDARAARISLLTERLRKLAALAKAGEASDYHIDTLRKDKAELAQLQRVHRSETDMLYFFYEYFSESGNPGNPDNLVPDVNVDMRARRTFTQNYRGYWTT